MNHRIITTSLSALFAGVSLAAAQNPANIQPTAEPNPSVPVLKEIPVKKYFIADDVEKQDRTFTKVKDGVFTFKSAGDGKGKATITIDVNGKRETREIDLGNATEIKITTDSDAAKPARVTFLGVAPEELPEELASQLPIDAGSGLLVRTVVPESPAATAGIQKHDVLIKLDDQILSAPKQLQKLVASRKPGETVRVIYFRRGQRAEAEAKLAEHEEPANPALDVFFNKFGNTSRDAVLHLQSDPLTFQKKIVIVDKEGNVLSKDDSEADQTATIKRLAGEVERMRDQAFAAQKQAQEAIRHAENAAREAAEIAKKEAAAVAERMRETLRQLQDQLEKREKREQ